MSESNQNSEKTINDIVDSSRALNLLFSDWVSKEDGIYTFNQDFKDKFKPYDEIKRIILTGAGSSYNVAYAGAYFFNSVSRIDATAILPSELLTLAPVKPPDNTLLVIISQSGGTKEIIKNLEAFKRKNPDIKILGLTATKKGKLWEYISQSNVIDINSGIEYGKTSTKVYVNSLMTLYLLACYYDGENEKERLANIQNSLSNYGKYIPWLKKEYDNINRYDNAKKYDGFITPSRFINKLEGYLKRSPLCKDDGRCKPIILVGTHSTYACAMEGRMKVLEFANYPCMHVDSTELKHATLNFLSPLHDIDFNNIPIVFLLPTSENDYENIKNDIDNAIDYAFLNIFKRKKSITNGKEIDIEEIIIKQVRDQSVDEILNSMLTLNNDEIEKEFFREWRKIVVRIINGIEIELGDAIIKEFRDKYKFFFICPWDLKETTRWKYYFEKDRYELFLTNQLERKGEKSDFDEIIIDEFKKQLERSPYWWRKRLILEIRGIFKNKKNNLKRIFIENPIISVTRKDLFPDNQFVYLNGKNQNNYLSEINDVQDFLIYIPFFWIFAYGFSKKLIDNKTPTSKQSIESPDNMLINKYYSYKPRHPKELEDQLNVLTKQIGDSERRLRRTRYNFERKINKWLAYGVPSLMVFSIITTSIILIIIIINIDNIFNFIIDNSIDSLKYKIINYLKVNIFELITAVMGGLAILGTIAHRTYKLIKKI